MGKRLIGLCGPTASGKTAVSVALAARLDGEVISADSMQIYRGMDVLSAKPDLDEMKGIRHHMIGVIDPKDSFNASRYREMAGALAEDAYRRGKTPILCGGTGLYIDALTKGMRMSEKADERLRAELKAIAQTEGGPERLHETLAALDPESAARYPAGDVRRVIRSIEIVRLTGLTRAEQERIDALTPDDYDARLFALEWPRDELYRRIDARVDEMLARGLINEVSKLIREGTDAHPTAIQAIGYKEIAAALRGETAMSDAIARMKTASRNYAKRQITWFRRDPRVTWLAAPGKTAGELADEIIARLRAEGSDM